MEFRKSKDCMGRAILKHSQIPITLALILAGASGNYLRMDKSRIQMFSKNTEAISTNFISNVNNLLF